MWVIEDPAVIYVGECFQAEVLNPKEAKSFVYFEVLNTEWFSGP